jgi:transcriptional regulator with XRE-family HTH domain
MLIGSCRKSSHIGYLDVKAKSSRFGYDDGSRYGYKSPMANRIKQLMKERRLSRDDVADAIGVHPITVSKLVSGKMKLTTEYLDKFGALFGVPPEQIIAPPSSTRIVKVRGSLQAGLWAESVEWDPDDWYDVAIPDDAALRTIPLYAGETRGPSMNRRYPERTVLVFAHIEDTQELLEPGKRYIVERERADGLREATVKTLWRDEEGRMWLVPESTDPRFQEPIPIEGGEDDTVRILGRIRYSVQRED